MEQLKKEVLNNWLNIDFHSIASQIGFCDSNIEISKELILNTLRCLDYETSVAKKPSVNYVITIMALMWEYIDHEKYDIRKIVVKFLSRIGYPTSAIIADDKFDRKKNMFSPLGSVLEQLFATLNQEKNSIIVNEREFLLTKFQIEIWTAMDKEKVIGISAPTSAGKSFVILLKLLDTLLKHKLDIVYIVPTLSLLNQVTEDFNKNIKTLNIPNCNVVNSYTGQENIDTNNIFILTQEKAISAFSDSENTFSKDMILVVDEIQNIERIKEDNDERAKILFDTLNEFRYKDNVKQIIISGPRISNIEKTGEEIFGIKTKNITTIDCPVLNLTYSICKIKDQYYLKQYCALCDNPLIMKITNPTIIEGYGKNKYNDEFLSYLNCFIEHLGQKQNIIFSPTAKVARKIACHLSGKGEVNSKIKDLERYYKKSVHPNYSMVKTLEKGVAYHHGKLPQHVRRTLEIAIRNKWITNIACTTTLLQGVNLPAQNIIIRNPHLYQNRNKYSPELSNYEMANLRGRAGRLMKDFIGRTFVLDETSFLDSESYDEENTFSDANKTLPTGYNERFEENRNDVEEIVMSNTPVNENMEKYGDLVSYIRQSVLRYGTRAVNKMKDVGIKLSKEQVAAIVLKLKSITVPKEICAKNRYWDPFVLDVIYKKYNEDVPNSPCKRGVCAKLNRMFKFLRDTPETNVMYKKYIPKRFQKGSTRSYLLNLCMSWSNETTLFDILSSNDYQNKAEDKIEDEIEDTIETLQNTVSYRVPLLLKPIFDIKNPDSVFLSSMQAGAYRTIPKNLIEMGIPRESALFIDKNIFNNFKIEENEEPFLIKEKLKKVVIEKRDTLPFWINEQLDVLG